MEERGASSGDSNVPPAEATVEPEAAFELLGHGIRLSILEAVFDAPEAPVPFSTIQAAIDVRDPGQINYHLNQLRPHFIERTDDGYVLARPGYNAVRFSKSGVVTGGRELSGNEVGDCIRCGGRLELSYRNQFATVACTDCGQWFLRWVFPPGAVDGRSPSTIAALLDQRCRTIRTLGNQGTCPMCDGMMGRSLGADDHFGHPAAYAYECEWCGCSFDSTVGAALVDHPTVVSFFHRHEIDLRERPLWTLDFAYRRDRIRVVERGPARVELTLAVDDDRLELEVSDETVRVLDGP